MPRVGFKPTIPAFERAKTVDALDREATVIGLWTTWRRENSRSYRDSNSDPSVVQPVASRYTDCAIPAPIVSFSVYVKCHVNVGQLHIFLTVCYAI
jgi:hypothetical protein